VSDQATSSESPAVKSSQAALPTDGKIIAIDWGEKRIGLAISDSDQRLAHPIGTLTRRQGRRFPLKQLRAHLESHNPVGVLVGLPLEQTGDEGPNARKAREAGELVGAKAGLPVAFWDERMTTARALRAVREMSGSTHGTTKNIDPLAATVLLQTYLDSLRS
jgi:putative Holliday junction resolvase